MPTCKPNTEPLEGSFPSQNTNPSSAATPRAPKRARKVPVPDGAVTARVLARLKALAKADGMIVRTHDQEERASRGGPLGCLYDPQDKPGGQASDLAFGIAFVRLPTRTELDSVKVEPLEQRAQQFASALLANLYAAEALALPLD